MMQGRRLGGSEDNKEIDLGIGSFVYVLQYYHINKVFILEKFNDFK